MRIEHIELPGWIVHECEERCPDLTWSQVIEQALTYVIDEADRARAERSSWLSDDDVMPTPPSAA